MKFLTKLSVFFSLNSYICMYQNHNELIKDHLLTTKNNLI